MYHRKLHNILPKKGLDHLTTWLLGDSLDSPNKTPIRQGVLHDSDPSCVANKLLLHIVERFSSSGLFRVALVCQCLGGIGVVMFIIVCHITNMSRLFLYELIMVAYCSPRKSICRRYWFDVTFGWRSGLCSLFLLRGSTVLERTLTTSHTGDFLIYLGTR
jgi:hypothetical protein